jgi:hypothetical protein
VTRLFVPYCQGRGQAKGQHHFFAIAKVQGMDFDESLHTDSWVERDWNLRPVQRTADLLSGLGFL